VPTIGADYEETHQLLQKLDLDAAGVSFWIKHLGLAEETEGRQFFSGGNISTLDDVRSIWFPDPHDRKLYEPLERFLEEFSKTDKALFCASNLGSDPVILGMGFENFCLSLYTNQEVVSEMLRRYFDWQAEVFSVLNTMDFDFLWTTDDIAYKSSTYIAPDDMRTFIFPGYKRVAERISKPWIFHSDGDLHDIMDDLVSLGMNGLHPIEPDAMDLVDIKNRYGDRLCLVGHIDVDRLSQGNPEEVDELVKTAIHTAGEGGGYICGSSNSITNYCKPENVIAMQQAIRLYSA
jgi:hypothetical protein